MSYSAKVIRKLPPAPEPTRAAYKKRVVGNWSEDMRVIELPCQYKPKPAPIPKRLTPKEREKERKKPLKRASVKYDRKSWNDKRIERLISLYKSGMPYDEIGTQMQSNEKTVAVMVSKLRRLGLIETRRCGAGWSDSQDQTLIEMYRDGVRYADIATACGKSSTSVGRRIDDLCRLGELERRDFRGCKKQ